MRPRPLLVGQAPSRTSDAERPLEARSGARLADLVGLPTEAYAAAFDRVNLLEAFPGRRGRKGDAFPCGPAREAATRLLPELARRARAGGVVVFLGGGVADAFGFCGPSLEVLAFQTEAGELRAARLPHPSRVNRWWNDPINRAAAGRFLRGLLLERSSS